MFDSVYSEYGDRIRQASVILASIEALSAGGTSEADELTKAQKGLLFILLYAAIEYSITASVSTFLSLLQTEARKPKEYKKYYLCTLLNAEFNAVLGSGKKKLWSKKAALLDGVFSEDPVSIDNAVFPTDAINIGRDQIVEIWKMFHLPEPIFPDGFNHWFLTEVKEHRNAIAHGREKASTIGGRFTLDQLQTRYRAVDYLCTHIIGTFENTFASKEYLAESA